MRSKIDPDFNDRQAAAQAARQAVLAKFKPKPAVQATEFVDRAAERAKKAAELRAAREAEKAHGRPKESRRAYQILPGNHPA